MEKEDNLGGDHGFENTLEILLASRTRNLGERYKDRIESMKRGGLQRSGGKIRKQKMKRSQKLQTNRGRGHGANFVVFHKFQEFFA